MKKYVPILKTSPLFFHIEEDNISDMLTCLSARKKSLRKEEYIWTAGDQITQVGIVLSGSVHIIKEDYWGNRSILAKLVPGEIFGESFAFAGIDKSPVSVATYEPTEILLVSTKKIITACPNTCPHHASLIDNMLKIMADKNRMLTQKIELLIKRTTREKLLSYLSVQAVSENSSSFHIPFNRQELADYLSVDRSAMSNELCKLRNEGLLTFRKNHFELQKL